MADQIFDTFSSQAKNFMSPVEKFNQALLKNMEKVAELQMETLRSIADIGGAQIKELSDIRDLEGIKAFSTNNVSRATEFNQKVMEDVKTMGEMGINLKHDVEQLLADFRENFQNSTQNSTKGSKDSVEEETPVSSAESSKSE